MPACPSNRGRTSHGMECPFNFQKCFVAVSTLLLQRLFYRKFLMLPKTFQRLHLHAERATGTPQQQTNNSCALGVVSSPLCRDKGWENAMIQFSSVSSLMVYRIHYSWSWLEEVFTTLLPLLFHCHQFHIRSHKSQPHSSCRHLFVRNLFTLSLAIWLCL